MKQANDIVLAGGIGYTARLELRIACSAFPAC